MKRLICTFGFFIIGAFAKAEINSTELMVNKIDEIKSILQKQNGDKNLEVKLYRDEAGTGRIYSKCTQTTSIVCTVYLTVKNEVPTSILSKLSTLMKEEIPLGVRPVDLKFELQPIVKYDDNHQAKVERVVLKSISVGSYQVILDSKTLEVKSVEGLINE